MGLSYCVCQRLTFMCLAVIWLREIINKQIRKRKFPFEIFWSLFVNKPFTKFNQSTVHKKGHTHSHTNTRTVWLSMRRVLFSVSWVEKYELHNYVRSQWHLVYSMVYRGINCILFEWQAAQERSIIMLAEWTHWPNKQINNNNNNKNAHWNSVSASVLRQMMNLNVRFNDQTFSYLIFKLPALRTANKEKEQSLARYSKHNGQFASSHACGYYSKSKITWLTVAHKCDTRQVMRLKRFIYTLAK